MSKESPVKKYSKLRWGLFAAGIAALLCLTLMNVYSLYKLHTQNINTDKKSKTAQLSSFTYEVRDRFYKPFWGFSRINMSALQNALQVDKEFPEKFIDVLTKASNDSLFDNIYFSANPRAECHNNQAINVYNSNEKKFIKAEFYPPLLCDSFDIAQTKMKNLLEEGYRWNNKVFFEDYRSMTLALVNLSEDEIVGYLAFIVNKDYLLNNYLAGKLEQNFGRSTQSGVVVWLRDWTQDEILVSSDPDIPYNETKVFERQKFPNLFDSWNLMMAYSDHAVINASKSSLTRNLVILGVVFLLLLGTLVFVFTTAQRERELSKRQATFLANVTHELKTPIAVMQAAGENLADGRVTDPVRLTNYGEHIYNESVRLKGMIERLLDVAKADADQTVVNAAPQNIKELIENLIAEKQDYINNKGFELDLDISSHWIMVDKNHFNTIFNNLLDNALKYSTDDKRIEIDVTESRNNVYFSITDHGIGIPQSAQKNIFEKFYRVEDSLTARTKGHGLGLSIVQHLVDLNGGDIDVQSRKNRGTTFTVCFKKLVDFKSESNVKQTENQYDYAEKQPG